MYLLLQHSVRDFDLWKTVFDEHADFRAKYGIVGHTLYRDADKPNDVTVVLDCRSRERAEELTRDPSLAEAQQRGGVIGKPRVTWLEEVDAATYTQGRAA